MKTVMPRFESLSDVCDLASSRAMLIQWPILTLLSFTSCFTGLVIYANFRGCDPYITGKITYPDQILPFFVMKYLGEPACRFCSSSIMNYPDEFKLALTPTHLLRRRHSRTTRFIHRRNILGGSQHCFFGDQLSGRCHL